MIEEILKELINQMEKQQTYVLRDIRKNAWDCAIGLVNAQLILLKKFHKTATGGNQVSFDQVIQHRTDAIHNTLDKKAKEYASDTDRFHNFRVAARINKTTPERALKGMMLKHEVSVLDMIENPHVLSEERINEKIGDNINYLILLEGLLKERLNE